MPTEEEARVEKANRLIEEITAEVADRDRLLAAAKDARLELMHGGFWPLVDRLDAAIAGR